MDMKMPDRNVTICYNFSQNEKQGFYFYGFNSNSECENVHIYNNTNYVSGERCCCVCGGADSH